MFIIRRIDVIDLIYEIGFLVFIGKEAVLSALLKTIKK
jgi:hypothetical protein